MTDLENKVKDFPNIKLSYENITYKKVYNADVILAIPEGKKCFAWFTTLNDKNVCLIMETTKNRQFQNIRVINACFSNDLSYGTILYGTVFFHKHNRFFAIEDIFYYKGKCIERENWGSKFSILNTLLNLNLKQISYNKTFIVFGLPLFSSNINGLINQIKSVTYNIDSIQFRGYNRANNYFIMLLKNFMEPVIIDNNNNNNKNNKNNKNNPIVITEKNNQRNILRREVVFKIKPDIQNDIYYLYCASDSCKEKEEYYNIAHIPDYNTSVFMNKLFRNIKENTNLDKLEESDDEEEFENEKEDKFVFLERVYNIICSYNYKFKKWVPIKLADDKTSIVKMKDLPNSERK